MTLQELVQLLYSIGKNNQSKTQINKSKQKTRVYITMTSNRPLERYVKLRVAHVPGMPGTFSPPPWVSDHGTCLTHVPWCMPGSLRVSFEVGNRDNFPSIPGACATSNFTYLVRGPWPLRHLSSPVSGLFVNSLLRLTWKENSRLLVTGESTVHRRIPSLRVSGTEGVSISWRLNEFVTQNVETPRIRIPCNVKSWKIRSLIQWVIIYNIPLS